MRQSGFKAIRGQGGPKRAYGMTMYVSKAWGFDVPCGPMVFGLRGWLTERP